MVRKVLEMRERGEEDAIGNGIEKWKRLQDEGKVKSGEK